MVLTEPVHADVSLCLQQLWDHHQKCVDVYHESSDGQVPLKLKTNTVNTSITITSA